MALTEESTISICQILGITPTNLEYQITLLGSRLTAAVETEIEAQIAIWDAGTGTKTVKLHPTESNKGVETNPSAARNDVKHNIAILLELETGSGRLMRG
jgi:hypothetical protein